MSTPEPSWDLYAAFLAVMQEGSLSGAARALHVAQPTVRRQLEKLESELDVVLFTRSPNGLTPTELAHATLPFAESIAATSRALVRSVSAPTSAARGTVRLGCSEVMGVEVMPQVLAELSQVHPQIEVELALSNRNEDLLKRTADLALRMVRPTQDGLRARRIGRIEVGLFATPAYLARRPAPKHPADVVGRHVLIGADREVGLGAALAAMGLETRPRDFALRTDNQLAQLAAIRAGLGIGVCQVPLARRTPVLQRVLPELRFELDAWVVMHEDLQGSLRVRTVFDHLVASIGRYVDRTPSVGAGA